MARRRRTRQDEPPPDEEDVDYVECPVCHGAGRGCKYCASHGDVHPDDVDAIIQTVQSEKNKKMFIGIGAGVLGVILIVAVVMIAKSNKNQGGSRPGGGKSAAPTKAPPKSVTFGNSAPPAGYSQDAKQLMLDMIFAKKCKNWDEVIKLGQQALPMTQDEIQKKNIQALIDEAQKKKGGG
jgi:hypothetical protein